MDDILQGIEQEMLDRVRWFNAQSKLIEAQRIEQRTRMDLEMIREIGFCSGCRGMLLSNDGFARVVARRREAGPPRVLVPEPVDPA